MAKSEDYISVLCLYSDYDEELKYLFEQHFELLYSQPNPYFNRIKYVAVEGIQESKVTDEEIKLYTDVVIVLLSATFLNAAYVRSYRMQAIIKLHNEQNLFLVPVLLKACDITGTSFTKMDVLPHPEHPVAAEHWQHIDEALNTISDAFKDILPKAKARKTEILNAWTMAKESDHIRGYDTFLRQFPRSVYREEANDRRNELLETQLWKNATRSNTVETLMEYLQDAPLREHEEDAKKKIIEIEADQNIAWEDATLNKDLAFYLNYRGRFPNDKARVEELDEAIATILNRPLDQIAHPDDLEEIQSDYTDEEHHTSFSTQSNYLSYLAIQELNPEELLSLILTLRYIESAERRVGGVVNVLKNNVGRWRLYSYGIIGFLFLYLSAFLLYDSVWENATVFSKVAVPFVLVVLAAIVVLYILPQIGKDLDLVIREKDLISQQRVGMKMAYLQYDEGERKTIIKDILQMEREAIDLKNKSVLSYFQFKEME